MDLTRSGVGVRCFAAWLGIAAAAAAASAGCGGGSTPPAPTTLRVPLGDSPVRGPADAWVTVVEFGDFECPGCRYEAPVLAQLSADYPQDVRVVFKHFPLDFHARAVPAAVAAECARDQDRFWEMQDALFASPLDDASLQMAATRVGLDLPRWGACRGTPAPLARVDADRALGIRLGVPGTPTVVVNGEVIGGREVPVLEEARAKVEAALTKARASGILRDRYYEQAVMGG